MAAEETPTGPSWQRVVIAAAVIFLLAFTVRLALSHNYLTELNSVMSSVVDAYKNDARWLAAGDLRHFIQGNAPPSDATILWHPPGYPILIAAVYLLFGESDAALRCIQTFVDCSGAVLVFLLARRMFSFPVGITAGILVALSPQIAFVSQLLQADAVAVVPLAAAMLLLLDREKDRSLVRAAAAGAFIAFSCWFRASGLFFPLFLSGFLLIFRMGYGWRYCATLVLVAYLLIAPLTIRNYVVFGDFIPVSLGGGLPMIEAVAQSDKEGLFGIAQTDLGIAAQEAELYGNPEYAHSPWNPDGVFRDKQRVRRTLGIAASNPTWYLSAAASRAARYLSPQRVPVLAGVEFEQAAPAWARAVGTVERVVGRTIFSPLLLWLFILTGVLLALRRYRERSWGLLFAPVLYTIAFHAFFYFDQRYVVEIWYFLLPFYGLALGSLGSVCLAAGKRRKRG